MLYMLSSYFSKICKLSFLFKGYSKNGFTLIELLLAVLILSLILVFAVDEYQKAAHETRVSKAKMDIEELIKAVRMHNINENRRFSAEKFVIEQLGHFVGTYLDIEPPLDPWNNPYRHSLKLGVVFSTGPSGVDNTTAVSTYTDDIVGRYLPKDFFITKAEYVDANHNNRVDFGDYVNVRFSRPARLDNPVIVDFETENPENAFGDAIVRETSDPFMVRIEFAGPEPPSLVLGETTVKPKKFVDSIVDYSPVPQRLSRFVGVPVRRSR